MKENVIITGAAGYIGQTISWYLYSKNYFPILIDRSSKKKIKKFKFGKIYNINAKDIDQILKKHKCNIILHCASKNIVWESKNNPIDYYKSNVSDTIEMLSKAVKYNVKKIVYASSSSVYGDIVEEKKITEKTLLNPTTCYGRTKKINEDIIKDFADAYGLKYVILRLFNVSGALNEVDFKHGPVFNSTAVIARTINLGQKRTNTKMIIPKVKNSNETPIRDFTHVKDIAQAFYKSIVYLKKKGRSEIFNIGSGSKGISVLDLIKKINNDLNINIKYSVSKKKKDNIGFMVPNIFKAKKILKYLPSESSLQNIVLSLNEWYKKK